MLYPPGAPERAGGAQPVGPAAAAAQWTHTVPSQMPWTLPASQQPFLRTAAISTGPFLRQHTPPVTHPATTSIAAPVDSAVRVLPDVGNLMNLPQTTTTGVPTTLSLNGVVGLPKTSPRQADASQQLVVYPGDPCTSSAPQSASSTGDTAATKSTSGGGLTSQNVQRPFFLSTSCCAPRFKRKFVSGHGAADGGTLSLSDESPDAVGGKIFVTERMVARMGDLSLHDTHQQGERCEISVSQTPDQQRSKIGSMGSESPLPPCDFTYEARVPQMSNTPFTHSNAVPVTPPQRYNRFRNTRDDTSARSGSMKQITLGDNDDVNLKDEQTPANAPVLICSGVKPSIGANSSIEQRLAIEMMKKSTLAVVLWSPLKSPLELASSSSSSASSPPTPSTSAAANAGPSNFDSGSTDMEQQESDSASLDGRVPLAEEIPERVGSMTEDVMEVM